MRKLEIQSKKLLLDDFFKIEEAILRFEQFDGTMSTPIRRLTFERGDGVGALVYNKESETVVLVEQFRYPTVSRGDGWILEVVAGMIDSEATPEETIRHEILEETGYRAETLEKICTFYVSPGGTSERMTLYYAEVENADKIGEGGGHAGEGEDIRVIEVPLDEAFTSLESGEIKDGKTVLALMWLRDRQSRVCS